MSITFTQLKSHFTNWREWELNPVVIKELRQSVRSWAVTGMLLLFLAVLFITTLIFLVNQSIDNNPMQELGATIFEVFIAILTIASVVFIPLHLGIRVALERVDSNPDLLYISTLTPGRIIRGKFFCGAYMAVLFFSACLPFMAFTNLLRGVDLPSVFFILLCLFLVVCGINMVAIFLACLPLSRPFKVLIALFGLMYSMSFVYGLVFASYRMMQSGIGAMMASPNFWISFLTYLAIGVTAVMLFYFLSVALISPPSANRAWPLRLFLTALWSLSGGVSLAWVIHLGNDEFMLPWAYFSLAVLVISMVVTISNQDQLSLRVRHAIPNGGAKRIIAFIFFNGAAGGLVWTVVIAAGTYVATMAIGTWIGGGASHVAGNNFQLIFPTVLAYALAYALAAVLIQRKFLAKRPPKMAGILMVLLAGVWAIAPGIILFFLNKLSWNAIEGLQLGNIFNVFYLHEQNGRVYHLVFAFAWLLVMLLLSFRWFARQVKNFRPPQRDVRPPVLE